jgi:hypothetical protein
LQVVVDEEQARACKDHAPANLARLRRFALNVLRANRTRGSTGGRNKRAGWTMPSPSASSLPPKAIAVGNRAIFLAERTALTR